MSKEVPTCCLSVTAVQVFQFCAPNWGTLGPEEGAFLFPSGGVLERHIESVCPGLESLIVEHHDAVTSVEEKQEQGLVPGGKGRNLQANR